MYCMREIIFLSILCFETTVSRILQVLIQELKFNRGYPYVLMFRLDGYIPDQHEGITLFPCTGDNITILKHLININLSIEVFEILNMNILRRRPFQFCLESCCICKWVFWYSQICYVSFINKKKLNETFLHRVCIVINLVTDGMMNLMNVILETNNCYHVPLTHFLSTVVQFQWPSSHFVSTF